MNPRCISRICALVVLLVATAYAGVRIALPFGKWHRASEGPILQPRGEGFESAGVFNPSVIMKDGKYVMLYRAQDRDGVSRLGYATSVDGIHFARNAEPG